MEMKLRKLWPLVGALCLGLMTSAFAHNNYQSGTSSNIDSGLQQETYQRGTFRQITPPAGARVAHGADVFFTGDFLWWQASEGPLPFAINGLNDAKILDDSDAQVFSSPVKGKVHSIEGVWAPGFKVGLGLNSGHDGWDISGQYTWLHANDSKSHKEASSRIFSGSKNNFPDTKNASYDTLQNSSKWNLHFNAIDFDLGRNFYLSQFLTSKFFIGLKGTWQKHTWDVTSSFTNLKIQTDADKPTQVALTGPLTDHKHYDVWGVGIRNGLNSAWHLTKSFSFYGDIALSGLWTNCYKQIQFSKLEDKNKKKHRTLVDISNPSFYNWKSVLELGLGIQWDTWFSEDAYHLGLKLGWEQQTWFNFSRLKNRDLSLGGGIFKFVLNF